MKRRNEDVDEIFNFHGSKKSKNNRSDEIISLLDELSKKSQESIFKRIYNNIWCLWK
jgi:hypothetical protein